MTLPQNILSTGNSSFYKCTGLTNAPIGTNIVSIGYGSFSYDSGLTNINFPGTLTSIGDIAFYQCTGLTSLTLPNSVLTVGSESFYSCVGLTNIVLDTNLTSIGTYAFWTCPYFTSIVIPDSVTNMGDYAFYGCTNLAHVKLSTNLANIPNWAFTYCNIPSIVIPACVTNIGDYALGGFYFVTTSLYFAGNAPTQGLGVLQGDTFGTTVYYLPGTTGWSSSFATYPTTLWNPLANTADGLFGIRTNRFGFNITGNSGLAVVVEGCTNLSHPNWIPLSTNVLLGGTSYFSDPASTSFPARFYGFTFP